MTDIELEAKFISQEHRFVQIWLNFWVERKRWGKLDPRSKAATKAFALYWLPSPSTIIVSGGILTIFSLYFIAKQTELMDIQNTLIEKQNSLFLKQLTEQRISGLATRKTELIKTIYSNEGEIKSRVLYSKSIPSTPARVRSEAIAEYLEIRRTEIKNNMSDFRKTGIIPITATLKFGIDLRWAPFQEINVNQLDMSHISLYHSNFQSAGLSYVDFSESQMEYVNLSNADLSGANFEKTSLVGADLTNANISHIKWSEETYVTNMNIYGVSNPPPGFLDWAIGRGAVVFQDKEEWLAKNLEMYPALEKHITSK